jgi:protein-tyrosine-phosphatase
VHVVRAPVRLRDPNVASVRSLALGILVVCTGNTCRSPMAEALLRHHLGAVGHDIEVASAGTLGWGSKPATPHAVEVLAERGVELAAHTSRRLTRAMVDDAEIVLAMTRTHAWAIAAHDPEAAARTFLLDELVRLAAASGARGGEDLGAWVAELDSRRPPDRLGRATDEVRDPAGEPIEVYRATADRLERSIHRLVPLL